ncbi:hypothetical protein AVEN_159412-1 [Araneus ventricosus]|uniref:Tc1-like transposase DDE domain-containing protein n=1 Tax=Araneus ventricosus TaxID=182803 RepID=A0A4Y2A1Y1_ARAVE|nr:hypothetical protein AVEN_159412-1 [Araneus ventricosus]
MAQRVSSIRNVRIWVYKNPHAIYDHGRDSPKINLFCAVSSSIVFCTFFFADKTVTGFACLDMLKIYLMPILKETMPECFIFQQDGVPCHFHK